MAYLLPSHTRAPHVYFASRKGYLSGVPSTG